MGATHALFCRNLVEACEERKHGNDKKEMIKVKTSSCKQRSG
jgi:hypothetical protein